jgi:hypothetical protein
MARAVVSCTTEAVIVWAHAVADGSEHNERIEMATFLTNPSSAASVHQLRYLQSWRATKELETSGLQK